MRHASCGDVVQLVRTLPCHGRGREFESRRPRHTSKQRLFTGPAVSQIHRLFTLSGCESVASGASQEPTLEHHAHSATEGLVRVAANTSDMSARQMGIKHCTTMGSNCVTLSATRRRTASSGGKP
jgi:hypothetical protein